MRFMVIVKASKDSEAGVMELREQGARLRAQTEKK